MDMVFLKDQGRIVCENLCVISNICRDYGFGLRGPLGANATVSGDHASYIDDNVNLDVSASNTHAEDRKDSDLAGLLTH